MKVEPTHKTEAIHQYQIISKMSFSQILDLIRNGYKNPTSPSRLRKGDTVLYHESFNVERLGRLLNAIERGLDDRTGRKLSLFIASSFIPMKRLQPEMQYWMYHINFVGDTLFKELYASPPSSSIHQIAMLERIDRPTIVFNVITGEKWICDWMHPKMAEDVKKEPELKWHSGSGGVFNVSKIAILNPHILYGNFLNWINENPLEVKQ